MLKRILFVDDEDWSVKPYFEKLRDRGCEVDLAVDGDGALAHLQQQRYDLVVLDIMLPPGEKMGRGVEPRKTGEVLLRRLRAGELPKLKTAAEVPVMVLTAVTDQKLADKLQELNVAHIFQKPASFAEVTDRLLELLFTKPGI